jgi:hypothetical protein
MPKKKTLARKPWTKEDLPRTQGSFEGKNARSQVREGDETDRRGGTAEGNYDRHRSRSPTLTTSDSRYR